MFFFQTLLLYLLYSPFACTSDIILKASLAILKLIFLPLKEYKYETECLEGVGDNAHRLTQIFHKRWKSLQSPIFTDIHVQIVALLIETEYHAQRDVDNCLQHHSLLFPFEEREHLFHQEEGVDDHQRVQKDDCTRGDLKSCCIQGI